MKTMMASYWKSPYKEPSYFDTYSPRTGSGRLQRSLSLSRANTSILTSGQDLLGWQLPPSNRPGSSQQFQKPVNGNLKGILKAPRSRLSPLSRHRANDVDDEAEANSEEASDPQRTSKRVSFGPCEDANEEEDSDYSVSNPRKFRAHYITLQRLNHSRRVEESAMQKLNRLISGVHVKTSPHSPVTNNNKSSSSKISPLPVVDGKGLLTPRPESQNKSSPCKEHSDLNCNECGRKDVETGEVDALSPTLQQGNYNDCNQLLFGINPDSDSLAPGEEGEPGLDTVKISIPVKNFDELTPGLTHERTASRRRSTPRKPKAVSFQNKRFHAKLLPGRYPFNTATMHMRSVAIKKHVNSISLERRRSELDLYDNKLETPISAIASRDKTNDEGHGDTGDSKIVSKPVTDKRTGSLEISTNRSPSSQIEGEIQPVPVLKPKTELRDRKYMDKTTQILTWLKDVKQKQNFKPRETRFVVIDSQSVQ